MLDRPADAHGNVQIRGDHLARLAHLQLVGHEARVHRSPGRTHRPAQLVRELLEHRKVVPGLHPTAARDHDPRTAQLGPLRARLGLGNKAAQAGIGRVGCRHFLNHGVSALLGAFLEAGAADQQHFHGVAAPDPRQRVASVHGSREGILAVDLHHIRHRRHVQLGRQARHEVQAEVGRGRQDVAVATLLLHRRYQGAHVLGQTMVIRGVTGHQNLAYAGQTRRVRRRTRRAGAAQEQVRFASELAGRSDAGQRAAGHLRTIMLRDDERAREAQVLRCGAAEGLRRSELSGHGAAVVDMPFREGRVYLPEISRSEHDWPNTRGKAPIFKYSAVGILARKDELQSKKMKSHSNLKRSPKLPITTFHSSNRVSLVFLGIFQAPGNCFNFPPLLLSRPCGARVFAQILRSPSRPIPPASPLLSSTGGSKQSSKAVTLLRRVRKKRAVVRT
eukprot:scaffold309_cov235-Pinguiococcus_pyrenoidosus.AAC.24